MITTIAQACFTKSTEGSAATTLFAPASLPDHGAWVSLPLREGIAMRVRTVSAALVLIGSTLILARAGAISARAKRHNFAPVSS